MTVGVVVCDGDELARRALDGVVAEHGFTLLAEATMAVEAVQLCQMHGAQVLAIGNELQGLSGLEVVAELEEQGIRVILIAHDQDVLEQARAAGAFFAVERGDLEMFDRALSAVGESRADDRRSGIDRRRGVDRRVHADWSKVTHERRVGGDRRQGERRSTAEADGGQALSA